MRHFTLISMLTAALLSGCIAAPEPPANGQQELLPGGVYVLCEGLWRQDNSALSYINPTASVVRDVVSNAVPQDVLGDTGADMIVKGDSLIIAMSTSQTLSVVRVSDGKLLGRVGTLGGREPTRLVRLGTSIFCTNLNDDSITEYDVTTLEVIVDRSEVGPAPEGIAAANGKLFVAISGLGDLRKDEQGAGTVRVINAEDLAMITEIRDLPNAADVCADTARGFVYVSFRHYASEVDSLGGVAKIDAESNEVIWTTRLPGPTRLALDGSTGDVYILTADGVDRLLADGTVERLIAHRSAGGNDVWYTIGFDDIQREVLIGNARSFVIDGEVLRVGLDGTIRARTQVAINPTVILRP